MIDIEDRDLREAVVEVQLVDSAILRTLAATRAETIRAFLVDALGAESNRVRIVDPIVLEESSSDGWIRCRLDVSTGE